VVVSAPLRISFCGGGTDLKSYYAHGRGAVVNCSINKYIYVTVKTMNPTFGSNYRLNYSKTEIVRQIDEIKNNIIRECLKMVSLPNPIYISTIADIPANSGLGSSSSFTVGLLKALHAIRGDDVSRSQLAEEACFIEIEKLKRKMGKQDAYISAFGGLNTFFFFSDGKVERNQVRICSNKLKYLFDHTLLFWTGISRDSSSIISDQEKKTILNLPVLDEMAKQVDVMRELLEGDCNLRSIGNLLKENWSMKRSLSNSISNLEIDNWYQTGLESGAYGGKICGAGGGGFLMFLAPANKHDLIRKNLSRLKEVKINYETHGTDELLRRYSS